MNQINMNHDDLAWFEGDMPTDGVLELPGFGAEVEYSIDTDDTVLLSFGDITADPGIWMTRKDIKVLRRLLANLLLEIE